jgi:hypothetical protein
MPGVGMEGSEVLIVAAEAWIRVWHCCLGPLFACGFRVDFRKDSRKTSEWTLNRMLKWIAVVLQRHGTAQYISSMEVGGLWIPATANAPSDGHLTFGPGPTYGMGITVINLQWKSELPESTAFEVHS